MNLYLKSLRDKYENLRSAIQGLQDRAAEENRDLAPEELRSVQEMSEQATQLHKQIESLTEVEVRNAKVAALQAKLALAQTEANDVTTQTGGDDDTQSGDQTRSTKLGAPRAYTKDRDPGYYTRTSKNSFFADMYRAKEYGDEEAQRRLTEHMRALDTQNDGPGVVPPRWLTEEFAEIARQGRALANAVRNFPLGDDPRPLTLPKQTSGTDAVVDEQADENDPVGDDDAWNSDVDNVVPKATSGAQKVSRQMIDMGSPAIDQLIFADLMGAYNDQIEARVGAAIMALRPPLDADSGVVPVTDSD